MCGRLVKRLHQLSNIDDGWHDGEGLAPTQEAVRSAFPLAYHLDGEGVGLFPTMSGGLSFEGAKLDIAISACGRATLARP